MLAAGKYYVGDLCYVLKEHNGFDWMEVLEKTGYLGLFVPGTQKNLDSDESTGYFTHKGIKFFSSKTAYGDGCYFDDEGREYGVDAGLIGCFPLESLSCAVDGLGHIVEFDENFSCTVCDGDGVIFIGDVEIDTDPSEEDEYNYGFDEDEDE